MKNKPLRLPGQSLNNEIRFLIDDKALNYILLPIFLLVFTIWNWLLHYQIIKITPSSLKFLTLFTILISIYCVFRIFKLIRKIKRLKLGRDGEIAVGQTLEYLRNKGFRIFHDIIGEGFNLDHVIVGEQGIFCVETKTYSKPSKGQCKITINHEGISVNGSKPNSKIFSQAKAQKAWLERKISLLTGINVPVQPVVVFPGWFVDNKLDDNSIWFLEPKGLLKYIEKAKVTLDKRTVKFISNQLSQFIRDNYDYNQYY